MCGICLHVEYCRNCSNPSTVRSQFVLLIRMELNGRQRSAGDRLHATGRSRPQRQSS